MKKFFYLLLPLLLLSCGNISNNNSNSSSESENKLADRVIEGYNKGYEHGAKDGLKNSYKESYGKGTNFLIVDQEELEYYHNGYAKGYDEGFKDGKAAYEEELAKRIEYSKQVLEDFGYGNVTVTTRSTPNTYSTPNINSGSLHYDEEIYGNYSYYEETDYCVEGVVVYEGDDDYYIVETRRGYTILERRSGSISEGHKVRGELNRYGNKYLINRNRDSEIRVYIEDYALSQDDAIEWMGEHDHLKDDDQRAYDAYNE